MRIAALTRREAKAARAVRAEITRATRGLPPDTSFDTKLYFQEVAEALDGALAEYDARPAWRRWLPLPGGPGEIPLRTALEQFKRHAEIHLERLPGDR